jgi:hypothetical protein
MVKEGIIMESIKVKRCEIEYKDMNYIIVNLMENVIDINGELYEYTISDDEKNLINDMIIEYKDMDDFEYWEDKTSETKPMPVMWRIGFYDEFDNYYHKSGALKYPPKFMELVDHLKKLNRI